MSTFWQDIRYGARTLLKNPGFTVVAVLSLALGIGANTTIFTIVNAVFLTPLPFSRPAELVAVYTVDENAAGGFGGLLGVSNPNYRDYRDKNEVLAGLAAYTFPLGASLMTRTGPEQVFTELVTGNYFQVLGVTAREGRVLLPEEDGAPGANPVAVISYGLWQRRFGGDPSVVGTTVTLNGTAFTIVGVTAEGFKGINSLLSPDMWVPGAMHAQFLPAQFRDWYDERRALLFNVIGRLRPSVSLEQAEANLKTIGRALEQEYPTPNKGRNVTLRPIAEAMIFPGLRQPLVLGGAVLMTVVGLVLLIACTNVANLLLARASARRQEIAVRIALGAGRKRLVRQLLTESVLIAVLGGIIGLLIASVAKDAIWSLRPAFVAQNFVELTLDVRVLAFTVVVSLATGVLFGLVPSMQATRADVVSAIKEEARSTGPSRRRFALSNALVVAQVALSLVALVAAGLFVRSLQGAHQIDPGFETERLAVVTVVPGQAGYSQARAEEFYRLVQERAEGLPGVRSAAWSSSVPLFGAFQRTVIPEGQDQQGNGRGQQFSNAITVSPGYFAATGIPILRGRDFTAADREGTRPVAIVNETVARRLWPNEEVIGRRFRFYGDEAPREIIGVARNSKYGTLGEDPQNAIYIPLAQNYAEVMVLFVRTDGDPAPALGAVQQQIRSIDRQVPLTAPFTMPQVIDTSLWAAKLGALLLGLLGGLALVLASVGLYGVMAYSVSQRQHEIGLRMALGAGQPAVLGQVLRQGMTLVAVGLVLGLAASFGVSRLVSTLLYGVSATDPITFAGVSTLLVLVALAASFVPAFRASRVDPLVALRS
jgi:predicted permease